jgi:prephenate dehydrogenase
MTLMGELDVVGYDADIANTKEARGRLAIDKVRRRLPKPWLGRIWWCWRCPPKPLRAALQSIAPHLGAGTVVTDVTSTKAIVGEWRRIIARCQPICGRASDGWPRKKSA